MILHLTPRTKVFLVLIARLHEFNIPGIRDRSPLPRECKPYGPPRKKGCRYVGRQGGWEGRKVGRKEVRTEGRKER